METNCLPTENLNENLKDYFVILTVTGGLATAFSALSPLVSSGGEWRLINDKPYCSFCETNNAHFTLIKVRVKFAYKPSGPSGQSLSQFL